MAEPGEFSMRAFFNKKLDLSQAEAIADLIASKSESAHKMAMHQMRGGFSKELNDLRQQLIDFSSLIELELDFSEEDVEFADRTQLENLTTEILKKIDDLIKSFSLGNAIKNGVPVAILGPPNAGKSTLLNVLLKEEKAIVSDIAGTTRDVIEDEVTIEGISFRFIDTAGLRETTDTIESLGIERSYSKAKEASLILYLLSAEDLKEPEMIQAYESFLNNKAEGKTVIPVINKSDLIDSDQIPASIQNPIVISAKNKLKIEDLNERLISTVNKERLDGSNLIVSNIRHLEALQKTEESLQNVVAGMSSGLPGDLLAMDIRQALHYLGEITGMVTPDDLLGNIFGKFCIGK
jgi:tRNA modification GTPase